MEASRGNTEGRRPTPDISWEQVIEDGVLRKILREADDGKAKVTSGLLSHHAPVQSAESTAGDMEVPSAGIPEADRLSGG